MSKDTIKGFEVDFRRKIIRVRYTDNTPETMITTETIVRSGRYNIPLKVSHKGFARKAEILIGQQVENVKKSGHSRAAKNSQLARLNSAEYKKDTARRLYNQHRYQKANEQAQHKIEEILDAISAAIEGI